MHKIYSYLGASPDGLVGDDGVIEVKCPYSERYSDINNIKVEYLDSEGNLKKKTQLFLTNTRNIRNDREGRCDFAVFTFKGLKCQRIFRNKSVWSSIVHLSNFSCFIIYHRFCFHMKTFKIMTESG